MNWTKAEKAVAKKAYELARKRDYDRLIKTINETPVKSADNIWELHDLLNQEAKAFNRRYDYRYSVLLEVFMDFVLDDLLSLEELKGLSKEKLALIGSVVEEEVIPEEIYEFKIIIDGIYPPIYRVLQIEKQASFFDLHVAIQLAFDWENAHLHEFRANGKTIGMSEMDEFGEEEILEERTLSLDHEISLNKDTLLYIYDFGDNWCHTVELVDTLPKSAKSYPKCTAGKRCRPPEDVGGIYGFESFKAIMKDKEDPEHEEMLMWYGGEFDPNRFSLREINGALKAYKKDEQEK